MAEAIKIIDLFSGAGGLTVGFEWLSGYPFQSVWANDFNDFAARSYNRNFAPVCISGDIVDLLSDPSTEIPEADVVVGGPPCQGFSLLNKQRSDDPRKKLWIPFMQVIDRSAARFFVMENVPQLLGSLEHEEIIEWAKARDFNVWSGELLAADYGVPQTRRRAFIIGSKDIHPDGFFPPPKTHYDPAKTHNQLTFDFAGYAKDPKRRRTVRDAISDLPRPVGTEIRNEPAPLNLHFGRNPTEKSRARYRAIPKEGMNRFDLQRIAPELTPECWIRKKTGGTDLFGRLWWDRPAFTIRTEFFKPEKGRYLHPEQHRPITHREAARFQSFPDDFIFEGTKIEIARQIGNAVPPLLAAAVARELYAMWMIKRESEHVHISGSQTAGDYVPGEKPEYATGSTG
ncbi:MAG: DNA cytosine methyltransferase [Spirochaetales bacterium]|nr:DNA cytosine methyltransferase [Spirochaetales bacterium]MCF7938170.1 DNA cytosine methyltransferase [Spirochaetales bacterium]